MNMWRVAWIHPEWVNELWAGDSGTDAVAIAAEASSLFRHPKARIGVQVAVGAGWLDVAATAAA